MSALHLDLISYAAMPFDLLDLRIIDQLQDDARRPYTKVGSSLGVTEGTVRKRVDRMVRQGLARFVLELDPYSLGLTWAYVGVRVRGATLRRAIERISEIPEVTIISSCTGGYDVILEVICTDQVDLFRILHDEIRASPGVEIADAFTVLQMHKDQYRYASLAKRLAEREL